MNPQKFLVVQILLEGLLPILGYFYWGWDASFIFLFYLIDWILFWLLSSFKAHKCIHVQQAPSSDLKRNKKQLFVGFLGIVTTSTLIFFLMYHVHPTFSWSERVWAFLSYSDMGIPQGIILIPLLALNGVMDYKQKFIVHQLYQKVPGHLFTKEVYKQGIIASLIFGLLLISSIFINLSDTVILFGTVIGVISYRLMYKKPFGF